MTRPWKPCVELVLECDNPSALRPKVVKFLQLANMPLPIIERAREVAIDVANNEAETTAKLYDALLRVSFAKTFDGTLLRRRF